MRLISRKLYVLLLMFSACFTSLTTLLLFPLLITSLSLCTVFDFVLSNIDEFLSINPSPKCVFFGDFKTYTHLRILALSYSGGTDRAGKLCYNFSISNEFTQMVNFPTWIPDCNSHSSGLFDVFLLTIVFVL